MSAGVQPGEVGKTAWLSEGFEELLLELEKPAKRGFVFDVIIVGSGYGGAIAAAGLAGWTKKQDGKDEEISVCVLERGREYLSGMFPSRLADLAGHVRFNTDGRPTPRGRREGLFDVRIGADVSAMVANGLGGGSLINAGVMEEPHEAMLRSWPSGLKADLLGKYFTDARTALHVHPKGIDGHPLRRTEKLKAFADLDAGVRAAALSIGVVRGQNDDDVSVGECKRCGDCATGCNHGAKNSLDFSMLARAKRLRAKIFTGATVLRVERDGLGGWQLEVVHTDEQLRKRQGAAAKLKARKLILAAGTFGSTEILLRSRSDALRFSTRLGQRFSSNGDAIAVIYDQGRPVKAVADEAEDPDGNKGLGRGIGPTITGILDLRDKVSGAGPVIEEIAIPGPLRRAFEEGVTTAKILHGLDTPDPGAHGADEKQHDPCAVNKDEIDRTSIFVMMGDDDAAGSLELVAGDGAECGDGAIKVRWPGLRDHRVFDRQMHALGRMALKAGKQARVIPNPLWQLLPGSMQFLVDEKRGPLLTVHPLGGCPIGESAYDGVVNDVGQVFDVRADDSGTSVFGDLVVLDGSIVRNALGVNPALTIAALALRATERLRAEWGFTAPTKGKDFLAPRPTFRVLLPPATGKPTEIELMERMKGEAMLLRKGWGKAACVVELTLYFEKCDLAGLARGVGGSRPMKRTLDAKGTARVFLKEDWDDWARRGGSEDDLCALVQMQAPIEGTLAFLHREPSTGEQRQRRAYKAYRCNRGMRDAWQEIVKRWRDGSLLRTWRELLERKQGALDLATHAGEVRLLEYDLDLCEPVVSDQRTSIDTDPFEAKAKIRGRKRLTYALRANPWRQLMEMELLEFPGMPGSAVLELDLKYLARKAQPLAKIVSQEDQVSAMADVGSFLAYMLRLLINIHLWSFRRPEAPAAREPQRLPGIIAGLPEPCIREIEMDPLKDGTPVVVRLTRYRRRNARGRPLVMIHGYSASGTTFAHHAVKPSMAQWFCLSGRDVWVLDLRTSSGMPTARHPWTFEDAALADLPAAFDAICKEARCEQLDVFAHCMGAAMFSMAVLAPPEPGQPFFREREVFPSRIHRAVLSQVAPVVVMSPANEFRGYAMSYLRHFLPFANYEFRARPDPGLVDQLIDRLLATLPYPEEEFAVENPPWFWRRTPFAGTRHRMDALYGRDFSLADKQGAPLLSDEVLEHIDDLFGPLNIDTVAQGIHFARTQLVTDRAGRNRYTLPANIRRWTFPTLSIHGTENGLADVATLQRFRNRFREMGVTIEVHECPGFGHQDSLIGKKAGEVFEVVGRYLEAR